MANDAPQKKQKVEKKPDGKGATPSGSTQRAPAPTPPGDKKASSPSKAVSGRAPASETRRASAPEKKPAPASETKRVPPPETKRVAPPSGVVSKDGKRSGRPDLPTNLSARIAGLDKVAEREEKRETLRTKRTRNVALKVTDRIETDRKKSRAGLYSLIGLIAAILIGLFVYSWIMIIPSDEGKLSSTMINLNGLRKPLTRVVALWSESDDSSADIDAPGPKQDAIRYCFKSHLNQLQSQTSQTGGIKKEDAEARRALDRFLNDKEYLKDFWGRKYKVECVRTKDNKGKVSSCVLYVKSLGPDGLDNSDAVRAFIRENPQFFKNPNADRALTDDDYRIHRDLNLKKDSNFKAYDAVVSQSIPFELQGKLLETFAVDQAFGRLPKSIDLSAFGVRSAEIGETEIKGKMTKSVTITFNQGDPVVVPIND